MPKYVALLRGIAPMNPNMRNEKLRAVCEEAGFRNVGSVISSGNIVFESPLRNARKIELLLEAAWLEKLGFNSTTIVRNLDELKALAGSDPFAGYEHGAKTLLNVTFLQQGSDKPMPLEGRGFRIVRASDREICCLVDSAEARTTNYMTVVERSYGKRITTRTWLTVNRIVKASSR